MQRAPPILFAGRSRVHVRKHYENKMAGSSFKGDARVSMSESEELEYSVVSITVMTRDSNGATDAGPSDNDLAYGNSSVSTDDTGKSLSDYRREIACYIQSPMTSGDVLPQQLLAKIDHIITLSEEDSLPTVRPSLILHTLNKAYQYGRITCYNKVHMGEASVQALGNFDTSFKKFLSSRMVGEEDRAMEEIETCRRLLKEAVKEGDDEVLRLKDLMDKDDAIATMKELDKARKEANSIILGDRQMLVAESDQFATDMAFIDDFLNDLVILLEQEGECSQENLKEGLLKRLEKKESELQTKLESSQADGESSEAGRSCVYQEKLIEQLQKMAGRLREVENITSVEDYKAVEEYYAAMEEITQWREELDTTHQQADTSLLIVDIMNEMMQLIVEDSKNKKKWLMGMLLRSLLQLRDALMATISLHLMGVDECKAICEEAGDQITIELHRQELTRHKERIKELHIQLTATDLHILKRCPQITLDSMDDRYEKRRKDVRLIYDKNDIAAVQLSSTGVYKGASHLQVVGLDAKQTGKKGDAQKRSTKALKPGRMNKKKFATHTLDQCSFCSKKFRGRSALQRHLLTHTGEKPFKCSTCERTFTQRGHLHKHMLTHTGERPHQCTICSKTFNRIGNLRRHALVHSGEKTHQCQYCQKKFARQGDLKPHILTHTGEKPFTCTQCPKTFNRRGNLLRHINACHSKEKGTAK